jgi:glucose dehydrogenase
MPELWQTLISLGVTTPDALGAHGSGGVLVTKAGLIFVGGGDCAFHAVDARTGRELWHATTRETSATPMTYRTASGRQFVVIATGRRTDATLAAFARPS